MGIYFVFQHIFMVISTLTKMESKGVSPLPSEGDKGALTQTPFVMKKQDN